MPSPSFQSLAAMLDHIWDLSALALALGLCLSGLALLLHALARKDVLRIDVLGKRILTIERAAVERKRRVAKSPPAKSTLP
jgi:hypothetical protein